MLGCVIKTHQPYKPMDNVERPPQMIPQEQLDFCEKLVRLAKEYGCSEFSMEFRAGIGAPANYHHTIKASWSHGRHGVPSAVLVTSERWDYLEV